MSTTQQGHSIIPSVYEELTGIGKDQPLEHGLYLLDMPTGSGKSWACIAVARKHLQGQYPFTGKIWLISNQNKNLDDFVRELVPLGALRLKDQVSTVQDFYEKYPDVVGAVRSCQCLAGSDTAPYLIDLLTKMKEGVEQFSLNNSKDFNQYIREEVVAKSLLAIKRKLGSIISSNIRKKLWSRAKIIETLKVEIPWSIDLFPDCKIDESKVIICTYKKLIKAQKSFPIGSQYLWELCDNDILMLDEFETSKNDFLDYSIDISLKNGYDVIKSFVNIRHNLITRIQPESIYAGKMIHKGTKKSKILSDIKQRFNKIYKDFQLEKNLKSTDNENERAFSNVIFSNQSIQLESKVSFLRYEKDRNYIDYKEQGTEDTVASLVYEVSSAIHDFAKTIQYDFLPDYNEASQSEMTAYYDDLKSLYNTFGFDEECMDYLLMQNKIIDLKRQLGIGKDIVCVEDTDIFLVPDHYEELITKYEEYINRHYPITALETASFITYLTSASVKADKQEKLINEFVNVQSRIEEKYPGKDRLSIFELLSTIKDKSCRYHISGYLDSQGYGELFAHEREQSNMERYYGGMNGFIYGIGKMSEDEYYYAAPDSEGIGQSPYDKAIRLYHKWDIQGHVPMQDIMPYLTAGWYALDNTSWPCIKKYLEEWLKRKYKNEWDL